MDNSLQALYQAYKNRDNKGCKHNSTAYENYAEAVKTQQFNVNPVEYQTGNKIHYMANTIIGNYMYNAKVIDTTYNTITIQPCGSSWKGKAIVLYKGDNVYIGKGWL